MQKPTVAYIRREPVPGVPPEKFQESIFHIELEMLVDLMEDFISIGAENEIAHTLGLEIVAHYKSLKKEK